MSRAKESSPLIWCLLVTLGAGSGCAHNLSALSSGFVGCAEYEIVISDEHLGMGPPTWTAECQGRKYYCSAIAGQYSTQVSCKESQPYPEAVPPPPPPAAASAGCRYDTQCKGTRICQAGRCVEPGAESPTNAACKRGDAVGCQAKCESGSSASCFSLGKMYEDGDGIAKDNERMAQYFNLACEKGDTAACTNLGNKYERGLGVAADPVRAVPLYLRACGLGSGYGCAAFGSLYETGKGVGQDRARAAELYDKACKGGNAAGCEGMKRTAQ